MLRRLCLLLSAVALFSASACTRSQIRPTVPLGHSEQYAVGQAREGTHLVLGGGVFAGNGIGLYRGMAGVDVQAGINYGLGPRYDFRLVAHLEVSGDDGLWYEIATTAGFRLNLSSVFSMELDTRVSLMPERGYRTVDDAETHTAKAALGAELALLSIRFGSARSYELTLWHALQAALGGSRGSAAFRTGLSFVHVWN